jgi:hypothetical protein
MDFASWLARKLQAELRAELQAELQAELETERLRLKAERLIATGQMPSLEKFLEVIGDVRTKYAPKILKARAEAATIMSKTARD